MEVVFRVGGLSGMFSVSNPETMVYSDLRTGQNIIPFAFGKYR